VPPTQLSAEIQLSHLLGELYGRFSAADAPGNLSLLDRLSLAWRERLLPASREGTSGRRPPGSRPPNPDGALLARDEIERLVDDWLDALAPAGTTRRGDPLLLPILVQSADDQQAGELLTDVRGMHRTALLVLGLEEYPRNLRGESAPVCTHCDQQTIMFDRNANRGDLWCGNAGWAASACHDDEHWPDCRDPETGVIRCRRSARSVRHHYFWEHWRWHELTRARPA
jgi:hypothetical protein